MLSLRRSEPSTPRPSAFPRPIGSSIPRAPGVQLASLRGDAGDVTGSIARNPLGQVIRPPQPHEFPTVDRSAKGDRLSSKGDRLPSAADAEPAIAPALPEDEAAANPVTPANEPTEDLNVKAGDGERGRSARSGTRGCAEVRAAAAVSCVEGHRLRCAHRARRRRARCAAAEGSRSRSRPRISTSATRRSAISAARSSAGSRAKSRGWCCRATSIPT